MNYFNAFGRVLADPSDTSYRQGFAVLKEHRIPFARFAACGFWPSDWKLYQTDPKEYYRRMDGVIAAAEQNGVGLIPSLFWRWNTVAEISGEPYSAWGDVGSRTHALMRRYTEEFVLRYRNSAAIWGWEFANEMSLGVELPNAKSLIAARKAIPHLGVPPPTEADIVSAKEMVTALSEFGKTVRRLDPHRIIISGNSAPRAGAWHNAAGKPWQPDTRQQFSEILIRDNPDPLSVLCVHWYPGHEKRFPDEKAGGMADVAKVMMDAARQSGKPLFIGEFGYEHGQDGFAELLNVIRKSRVPLSALWVFDLRQQENNWSVTISNERAYMLRAISEANISLSNEKR